MKGRTRLAIAIGMTDEKEPLASLWQSALGQIDEIRDVIVRGSQAGKAKLDVQLLKRQRERLLTQMGAAVLDDAQRGVALPGSCEELGKRVLEIDQQIADAEAEAHKALKRREST